MTAGLDPGTHRALVEAGYAPLPDYIARFAPTEGPTLSIQDTRNLPERSRHEPGEPCAARTLRVFVLSALLGAVVGFAAVTVVCIPAVGHWLQHGNTGWETAR